MGLCGVGVRGCLGRVRAHTPAGHGQGASAWCALCALLFWQKSAPLQRVRADDAYTHAHAYERINTIYKRMTEAHRVLSDPGLRARYNLGIQQRGELRLSQSRASKREETELAMCATDAARSSPRCWMPRL